MHTCVKVNKRKEMYQMHGNNILYEKRLQSRTQIKRNNQLIEIEGQRKMQPKAMISFRVSHTRTHVQTKTTQKKKQKKNVHRCWLTTQEDALQHVS